MPRACTTYGGEVHKEFFGGGGEPRRRDHLKLLGVNGIIILKLIFKKCDGGHGTDRSGSARGRVAGSGECYNESPGSIKCGEFLD